MSEAPNARTKMLPAGTVLYHGTRADWDERKAAPNGPFWVTDNVSVAGWFRDYYSAGDRPRIITFRTKKPLRLLLMGKTSFRRYEAMSDSDDTLYIADLVCGDSYDGWMSPPGGHILPNGQSGLDIMLCQPARALAHADTRDW